MILLGISRGGRAARGDAAAGGEWIPRVCEPVEHDDAEVQTLFDRNIRAQAEKREALQQLRRDAAVAIDQDRIVLPRQHRVGDDLSLRRQQCAIPDFAWRDPDRGHRQETVEEAFGISAANRNNRAGGEKLGLGIVLN